MVGRLSRHQLCEVLTDMQGRQYLGERRRYTYRELTDNRFHIIAAGDTIFVLASQYFQGADRPALLYWVIADFQPTPIHDVTVPLVPGRTLVIPSLRTLMEEILNPGRSSEFTG